jgi:hypothetical protein
MSQSPYHQEKGPWYPLHRRLGGPKTQLGCCGEGKNILLLPRLNLNSSAVQLIAQFSILTELSQLIIVVHNNCHKM